MFLEECALPGKRPSAGIELGAFRLVAPIAKGAMGQVFSAVHSVSDFAIPVAIKVITADRAQDERFWTYFRNEARAVAGLDHPGITFLYDYGHVSPEAAARSGGGLRAGSPWMAMEMCSGGTLSERCRAPLPWREVKSTLLLLLDALAHAHARSLIHCDLKPANVLLPAGAERKGPKLSDFGIAWALDDGPRQGTPGTPHYMPPEQFERRWRDVGPWTDLYALGCLGWALATGRPPFAAEVGENLVLAHLTRQPPAFWPRTPVPAGFQEWLRRLLAKAPENRFDRASDAAWALVRLGDVDDGSEDSAREPLIEEMPTLTVVRACTSTGASSGDLSLDARPQGVQTSSRAAVEATWRPSACARAS
jgi:serine/threonine protein kinase